MRELKQINSSSTERPLEVWILTIWLGLFAGLAPIGLWANAYRFESVRDFFGLTLWKLALGLSLGLGIILSSIFTWRGNRIARLILIVLATLHYGSLAYTNFILTFSDAITPEQVSLTLGRSARSAIMIPIVIWFLGFSEKARSFSTG